MRDMRLVRPTVHGRAHLRRVQLRLVRGAVRRLRRHRRIRRVLLQRVRADGEGSRRLSQDCESGQHQDGSVLRAEEVWV